jgi:cellobiose phosphorylase
MHANEGLFSYFQKAVEGQEPKIAFFLGLRVSRDAFCPLPLFNVPEISQSASPNIQRYTVFTPTAAYYFLLAKPLMLTLRVFVSRQKQITFSLLAENLGLNNERFFISSYFNPFFRHQLFETDEDRWFKDAIWLGRDMARAISSRFLVRVNENIDRRTLFTQQGMIQCRWNRDAGAKVLRHQATTSRLQYVGASVSSLHTPQALMHGTFPEARHRCTFNDTAIAADIIHLSLAGGRVTRFDWNCELVSLNVPFPPPVFVSLNVKALDREEKRLCADDLKHHETLCMRLHGGIRQGAKAGTFNAFVEFLKRQVEFCSLIKGYVQLSPNSLIGIRDLFQALEALAYWQPDTARARIKEALNFMTPSGRCFRQYSLPLPGGQIGKMDLRPFIDQGSWVISAVHTYLRLTGDSSLLREICGYHDIVDTSRGIVRTSREMNSLLTHLVRIMDYLLSQRDVPGTGCVKALYGDWNDALDGLGNTARPNAEFGTGVSVMASLHVLRNVQEMLDIFHFTGNRLPEKKRRFYYRAAKELREALKRQALQKRRAGVTRILHGWGDQRSYLVGSFCDTDGQPRDSLMANVFWVLSGLCRETPELLPSIRSALARLDSKFGYRTFNPPFPEHAPGVGRIVQLPPGTAENGATYVHATAFAIMALFEIGEPRLAWKQLWKILPFSRIHVHLSHSPFVMPNSYGYNSKLHIDGQSMNDWQTGSSNVVLKLLIRFVFGFEPDFNGIWIQPASWLPANSFDFSIRHRNCELSINYLRQRRKTRVFLINNSPVEGTWEKQMKMFRLFVPTKFFNSKSLRVIVLDPD